MINTIINNLYSNKVRPKIEGNLEEPVYVVKKEALGFINLIKNIHDIVTKLILILISSFLVFISFSIDMKIGILSLILISLIFSYNRNGLVYIIIQSSKLYIGRKYINIVFFVKKKISILIEDVISEKCKKYLALIINLTIVGFFMGFNITIKICFLLTTIAILKEIFLINMQRNK